MFGIYATIFASSLCYQFVCYFAILFLIAMVLNIYEKKK